MHTCPPWCLADAGMGDAIEEKFHDHYPITKDPRGSKIFFLIENLLNNLTANF